MCVSVSESFMPPGQLMEELLIDCVALLAAACRHENVASDKLMNNFTVCSHTAEGDVHVPFKLYGHLKSNKTNIRLGSSFKKKVTLTLVKYSVTLYSPLPKISIL